MPYATRRHYKVNIPYFGRDKEANRIKTTLRGWGKKTTRKIEKKRRDEYTTTTLHKIKDYRSRNRISISFEWLRIMASNAIGWTVYPAFFLPKYSFAPLLKLYATCLPFFRAFRRCTPPFLQRLLLTLDYIITSTFSTFDFDDVSASRKLTSHRRLASSEKLTISTFARSASR